MIGQKMKERDVSITMEYDPEAMAAEWGWLWVENAVLGPGWVMIATTGGGEGEAPTAILFDMDEEDDPAQELDTAKLKGLPYLPMIQPKCEPNAARVEKSWRV